MVTPLRRVTPLKWAFCVLCALSAAAIAQQEVHWSYDEAEHRGSAGWGALEDGDGRVAFPDCNLHEQSPIDISAVSEGGELSIDFDWADTPLSVLSNGHTIQVNYGPGSTTTIDGTVWPLLQFHWHTYSEHTLNRELLPAEAHMVHAGSDGASFAVVGILFEYGDANETLQALLHVMEDNQVGGHYQVGTFAGAGTVNAEGLLPDDHAAYTYAGSFTTPPCTEGVNWNVMQETRTVSRAQVEAFKKILDDVQHYDTNNRPVQPLNGRTVSARDVR